MAAVVLGSTLLLTLGAVVRPPPAWRARQGVPAETFVKLGQLRGAPPCLGQLEKIGQGHESAWLLAHQSIDSDELAISIALDRNPDVPCYKLMWHTVDDRKKLCYMLLEAGDDFSSLRGMWIAEDARGRGLSRVLLAAWLRLCLDAAISPSTRTINKPLLSLSLGRFGFEPTNQRAQKVAVTPAIRLSDALRAMPTTRTAFVRTEFALPASSDTASHLAAVVSKTLDEAGSMVEPAGSSVALREALTLKRASSSTSTPNARSSRATPIRMSASTDTPASSSSSAASATTLPREYSTWEWRGHTIRTRVEGPASGQKLLLIHGFGASLNHFRDNIPALCEAGYRVHAIDLLGLGGSDKPLLPEEPFEGGGPGEGYSMELWGNQTVDYVRSVMAEEEQQQEEGADDGKKWVLAGNSIGGLTSLLAANALGPSIVRGVCLLNTAGGMNFNRYADIPLLLRPFIWLFRNVLLDPNGNGPKYFENFKTEENVRTVLRQVYPKRPERVDDALVESILWPAENPNAVNVFLAIFRGPPGPPPESVLTELEGTPILGLWGRDDPWTPMARGRTPCATEFDKYCSTFTLQPIDGVGHCPHDEAPEAVNSAMLEWLSGLD